MRTAPAAPDHASSTLRLLPRASEAATSSDDLAVHDIALWVDNVAQAHRNAVLAGAQDLLPPHATTHDDLPVICARVGGVGSLVHTLLQRAERPGRPGFAPPSPSPMIDHVAICVPRGTLGATMRFYGMALGMRVTQRERIETRHYELVTVVMQSAGGQLKFVIVESLRCRQPTQIERFLDASDGKAGVQHLALGVSGVVDTGLKLKRRGLGFVPSKDEMFQSMLERVGGLSLQRTVAVELGIMADRDADGMLLQCFMLPGDQPEPVFFFELIERLGSRGFGAGNIRALFEAVEREQAQYTQCDSV
jgi:4-hydroxyphenylpyruvate dioxygenase